MTRVNKQAPQTGSESDMNAPTPERAPHESNYGFEADHPSYKLRKAGVWSPHPGASKSYGPEDPPPVAPADAARSDPGNPGKKQQP